MKFVSGVCGIVTLLMGALHVCLLFGAPLGEYVMGGTVRIMPRKKRWINFLFAAIFGFLGCLYLGNADVLYALFSSRAVKIMMGLYTAFLAYAVFGNIFFTNSRKEKIVMIPASAIGFISSLLVLTFT